MVFVDIARVEEALAEYVAMKRLLWSWRVLWWKVLVCLLVVTLLTDKSLKLVFSWLTLALAKA